LEPANHEGTKGSKTLDGMMNLRVLRVLVVVFCTAAFGGCRGRQSAAPAEEQTSWRKLGEWSGTGSQQTSSFTSDSGALRIHWKTTAHPGAIAPGTFVLTIHSSISGRVLQLAVEHQGPGEDVTYVTDDPHVFFADIQSKGLDWWFTVEEGYSGPVVK
jgi:hypothetical protein